MTRAQAIDTPVAKPRRNALHLGRTTRVALALSTLLFFAPGLAATASAAEPPLLRTFCPTGSAAGQCKGPRGIAVDPSDGSVYVADLSNFRVNKFTPWGEFLRAWGRDVVASGPGDNGTGFEICVPADGDTCKAGIAGSDRGEFGGTGGGGFLPGGPVGVALDATGDVYVTNPTNLRVQKFGPDGQFLLMFGGDVNQTKVEEGKPEAERNLCPIDPGDVCQEGTKGSGQGQFAAFNSKDSIDVGPDGESVFVGDLERIQQFDSSGQFTGEIKRPGESVDELAIDPDGNLYVAQARLGATTRPDAFKLSPAGEPLCTIEANNPSALATGPGGEVYLVDERDFFVTHSPREISRFNSNCGGKEVLFGPEPPGNQFTADPNGIAASTACGIEGVDLFISNPHVESSFVKLFGPPPTDFNPPCVPPPSVPPTIAYTYALSVGADTASVRAAINPHFWNDTTYSVQYATAACIEAEGWGAPCVAQAPSSPQLLSPEVFDEARPTRKVLLGASQPLAPDTSYRYRFTAQGTGSGGAPVLGPEETLRTYPLPAAAKADCPNQGLRTGPSSRLPDCRAYELVSPIDKNGGDVASPRLTVLDQAAADGGALTFASSTGFAEPEGATLYNQYLAERATDGWATHSINPARGSVSVVEFENLVTRYKAFDESLCSGWFLQETDLPLVGGAVPRGVINLYRRGGLHGGCPAAGFELLTTTFPPGYDPALEKNKSNYFAHFQGFSADGQTSVFRAKAALSPNACDTPNEGKGIYQLYLSREGTPGVAPTLISVLPGGEAACTHSSLGTAQSVDGTFQTREDALHNAVSEDASRVYWTATQDAAPGAGVKPGHIYLRLNPAQPQSALNKAGKCTEAAKACTYPVSEEAEALSGTDASRYLDAAADGSLAYFSTGTDLYEFELSKALAKDPAVTLIAGKVIGVMGASQDASRLYLVSEEELEGEGKAGEPNLYLYQRGAGLDFVATLGGPFDAALTTNATVSSAIEIAPTKRNSRVTPDGLHAVFTAADPALAQAVAGYDNTDAASGKPDRELYLYDATANGGVGSLVCASCNPSGARPAGRLTEDLTGNPEDDIWAAARLPGWITSMHPGNLLSADGSRLFFESFEPLVLRDTNGMGDVYQWKAAQSKAQCTEEQGGELYVPASGGCLSLISSGTGSADSQLIDASATGDDVFFHTTSSLLPQDPGLADAYDARALGGFPQPTQAAACEGEACQSPPAAPDDPTPASSSFEGAGNVTGTPARPKCKKPKLRRHGRCVRKHRRAKPRRHRRANANRKAAR